VSKRWFRLTLIVLAIASLLVLGCDKSTNPDHPDSTVPRWVTYHVSNSGLASNAIEAIAIDASDNKWFGTWSGGVSKFDGSAWTTYMTFNSGLADNIVHAIAIDASGNKWLGTWGGGVDLPPENWSS